MIRKVKLRKYFSLNSTSLFLHNKEEAEFREVILPVFGSDNNVSICTNFKNSKMKYLKNNTHLFMTLVILAGIFCSCEKEQYSEPKSAKVIVTNSEVKGGDDEEESIIQGIVQDGDTVAIIGAQVEIFRINTTNALLTENTDSNGAFQMTVSNGAYFIEVTENGVVSTTDDFNIDGNASVVITLD